MSHDNDNKSVAFLPGEEMGYLGILVVIALTIFAFAYVFGLCPRWMY